MLSHSFLVAQVAEEIPSWMNNLATWAIIIGVGLMAFAFITNAIQKKKKQQQQEENEQG